jgi:hypothetical protein
VAVGVLVGAEVFVGVGLGPGVGVLVGVFVTAGVGVAVAVVEQACGGAPANAINSFGEFAPSFEE